MSKTKSKATAPAPSQGEAGPASAPAEVRTQAAPKPTATRKPGPRNPDPGTPAANLPNEAQVEAQFLAELENSLPADIEGVAPKRTTQRTPAAGPPDDDPAGEQEAPADEQVTESTPSDQSYPSDQSDPTADDATDETGVDPETTNEGQEDDQLDEEDLGALAALDEAQLDAHATDRQWPPSYLKRVKKFTKQLRAAQARADRLEEQQAETREPKNPEPETRNLEPAAAPGALSAREGQLAAEIAQHEQWLAQIDEVEPGGSLVVGQQTFGPEQLKSARRVLERKLTTRAIALENAQQERAEQIRACEAEAVIRHPWLKDRSNPDTAAIQNVMHIYPVLAQIPNVRALLADALTYRKLLAKARAQAGNGNGNGTNGSKFRVPSSELEQNGQPGTRNQKPGTAARGPARPAAAVLPAPRRGPDLSGRLAKVMETGSRKDAESILMDLVEK